MGAELSRERAGEKTKTGMNEDQLADFARKPIVKSLVDRIDAFIEKAVKTEEEKLAEIERFRRHSGSTGRGNNERMRAREQGKLHKGDK